MASTCDEDQQLGLEWWRKGDVCERKEKSTDGYLILVTKDLDSLRNGGGGGGLVGDDSSL